MSNLPETKPNLFRWCSWFFAANILLFWLLGLRYFSTSAWLDSSSLTHHGRMVLTTYFTVSYIGQLGLLAFLPSLIIFMLIQIIPRKNIIFPLAAILATFTSALFLCDTLLYGLYHFHLNGIVIDYFLSSGAEQFFDFSTTEIAMGISTLIALLLAEIAFAYLIWFLVIGKNALRGYGKWFVIVVGICFYTSYTMLLFSVKYPFGHFLLESSRELPFYTESLGALLPFKNGKVALLRVYEGYLIQPAQANHPLHYPLQPLALKPNKSPLNILIIGVDTWRYDMLKPAETPNIYQFAKKSWVFEQHYSGGNATGPGIFSLFYSLPSTYWTSMRNQHRGPLLIDELLKQHYQFKILASAGLESPEFNHTVFQALPNLQLSMKGKNPHERDLMVTREFEKFLQQVDKSHQPFFSFLFYDSVHGFCTTKIDEFLFEPSIKKCMRVRLSNATDPIPYLNLYRNALHMTDKEVGKVLDALQAHHLLDNTVVIITGDHGEEFNDNHHNYWGHASNFTQHQLQTPLIVYWPQESPRTISYITTHYDIAPTLLSRLFGNKTPANQFSLGEDLLTPKTLPYLFVASYIGEGVVEKDRITNIMPMGAYRITDLHSKVQPDAKLHVNIMHDALNDMMRFYQK